MKKRWMKWAALLVAIAMALPLTACGRLDSGDGVVRLRWVTYGGAVPADLKEVIAAANAYSREKIGVVVDLELQPSDMLNLIMASGEYYDIMYTCEWLNSYDKAAAKGLYRDITDLAPSVAPELYAAIGDYWEAAELDGRIYGVPTLKDMGTEMMYRLNADYFEGEKGMEIPEHMAWIDQ